MFLKIDNFLSAAEVRTLAELAHQAKFVEGRRSNPHNATKNNVIQDPNDAMAQKGSQIALAAFQRNEEVRRFVFPQRVASPTFSRYDVGMEYGPHSDAAFLPIGQQPLRSDVSCTMFIASPNEYAGGELLVYLGSEIVSIKGEAGSAIFYPSTSVHQVVPVTAGSRLVMITFIESQIPDQQQRDLLYTLGEIRALEGLKMDWRTRTHLEYVIANLHRMWSR